MSRFANNIEKMAWDQSGWTMIEESADGSVVYMGRPSSPDATLDAPVWCIKRITVTITEDGRRLTEIKRTENCQKRWTDRENLTYTF